MRDFRKVPSESAANLFSMLTPLIALLLVQTPKPMLDQISKDRMRATVEKLASFNTRNTNTPGLTEAAEWVAAEYRKIPGLQVEIMHYTAPKSRRVPEEKDVVQVVAKLPGEDGQIVMVGGHMDSINLAADIQTGRAPGANDDASGTALALEMARVMSTKKWKHTLMFVAFSGEEQGLLGSTALAKRAKAENWKIIGVLSNDMVGSSGNNNGQKDVRHVRVFSEDATSQPRATVGADQSVSTGGQSAGTRSALPPHQSRELARYIEWLTRSNKDFNVKLVFRKDRFGRGGDHSPFNDQGFTAVRFVEVHEEYSRQHTPDDLPKFMDWNYLANSAKMNLMALSSLADCPAPPEDVKVDLKQGHDTTLHWKATPGVIYTVYWRETTGPVWESSRSVGAVATATIEKVNKDDHVFAVGAGGGIPVEAK